MGRRAGASATVLAAADEIEVRLHESGDPARAEGEARYLKSALDHVGVTVPGVRKIARTTMRSHGVADHDGLIALADLLWRPEVHESRLAGVEALKYRVSALDAADLPQIESMLRTARTWALVDPLAADVVGPIVAADTSASTTTDRWARDDDFWVRRSALLSQLVALRSGHGDFERFSRYADAMLDEREFFIRKAIGWVLRDTGRRRPQLVEAWLRDRPGRVPVLAVREAVKGLPDHAAAELIAAARRR